jgi:putative phage-type endonuclease
MVEYIEDKELFSNTAKVVFDAREDSQERTEWLKRRTNSIGGSEIGMIAGFSNYGSALTVYNDKLGLVKRFDGNVHTEFGNRMEPLIREWVQNDFQKATDIELKTYEYPFMMADKEYEFFSANIDGLAVLKENWTYRENKDTGEVWYIPANEYVGLEIKTASEFLKNMWDGEEIPAQYYLQCQWYMMITGLKYFLIVYMLGKEIQWKVVPRCDDDIQAIREFGKDFWNNHIIPKIPPDVSGIKRETEEITEQQTLKDDIDVAISDSKLERYIELSEKEKEIQKEKELIKQKIFLEMENSKKGISNDGEFKINRFPVTRENLDIKRLKEQHPNIYKEYLKESTTFINLRVSKIKKEGN